MIAKCWIWEYVEVVFLNLENINQQMIVTFAFRFCQIWTSKGRTKSKRENFRGFRQSMEEEFGWRWNFCGFLVHENRSWHSLWLIFQFEKDFHSFLSHFDFPLNCFFYRIASETEILKVFKRFLQNSMDWIEWIKWFFLCCFSS
jgi:hypothetical protein